MRRAAAREREPHLSLVLVLPTVPVTATICACSGRGAARPRSLKPSSASATTISGASAATPPRLLRETRAAPRPRSAPADEIVPVVDVALDGDESVARLDRAGVDRDAGDGRRQRAQPLGAPPAATTSATVQSALTAACVLQRRHHLFLVGEWCTLRR